MHGSARNWRRTSLMILEAVLLTARSATETEADLSKGKDCLENHMRSSIH